jgi:hypothetical protein
MLEDATLDEDTAEAVDGFLMSSEYCETEDDAAKKRKLLFAALDPSGAKQEAATDQPDDTMKLLDPGSNLSLADESDVNIMGFHARAQKATGNDMSNSSQEMDFQSEDKRKEKKRQKEEQKIK